MATFSCILNILWYFLVSFKENERITGLGVFLSAKRRRLRAILGVRQIPAEGEEEKRRRKEEEKRREKNKKRREEENMKEKMKKRRRKDEESTKNER